jgi:hypothetical protein
MTEKLLPPSLDGPIVQALLDLLPGTLHVKDRHYRYCMVNRNYLESRAPCAIPSRARRTS